SPRFSRSGRRRRRASSRPCCSASASGPGALEPDDPAWPLWVRGGPLGAAVDLETSREAVRSRLAPLLADEVVIVCGFLGREGSRLCTLGRGGSDVTATALGYLLEAEEVVLVKDVPGIFDADPRAVASARPLPEITADDAETLARGGSRVIAPDAFRFLRPGTRLRVIPFGSPWTTTSGTEVRPPSSRRPGAVPGSAPDTTERAAVACITLLPESGRTGIDELGRVVPPARWRGLSAAPGVLTVFLDEAEVSAAVEALHASGSFRGISSRVGLTQLRCASIEEGRSSTSLPR
ncbi:secreted protein containing Aspartate/glutamate/uridylate kinase domain protein, partial [mine drainage metagenome]